MNIAHRFCAYFLLATLAAGVLASLDARAATCELTPTFVQLQDRAIATTALKLDVRFEVADKDMETLNGFSHARLNIIRINPDVCDRPPIYRTYVIAHELGHIIADRLHPELTAKVGLKTVPKEQQETMAHIYGSRLLTPAENDALLAYFDSECVAGSTYGCEHATLWRWSRTR